MVHTVTDHQSPDGKELDAVLFQVSPTDSLHFNCVRQVRAPSAEQDEQEMLLEAKPTG